MDHLAELKKRIQVQGWPPRDGAALPIVSLEDFFVGNSDFGSIGCNLPNCPGPSGFCAVLRDIRDRESVQDVLVEINEVSNSDDTWPFSDRVYVLSSASIDQVRHWLSDLQPDSVSEGWSNGVPLAAPLLHPHVKVFSAWWD